MLIFAVEPSSYKNIVITSPLLPFLGNPFFSDRKMGSDGRHICVQASVVTMKVKPMISMFGDVRSSPSFYLRKGDGAEGRGTRKRQKEEERRGKREARKVSSFFYLVF